MPQPQQLHSVKLLKFRVVLRWVKMSLPRATEATLVSLTLVDLCKSSSTVLNWWMTAPMSSFFSVILNTTDRISGECYEE